MPTSPELRPKICRIVSVEGFDNVLLGRDFAGIFQPGRIYSIVEMAGVHIITDVGPANPPDRGSSLGQILLEGSHLLTVNEHKAQMDSYRDDEDDD